MNFLETGSETKHHKKHYDSNVITEMILRCSSLIEKCVWFQSQLTLEKNRWGLKKIVEAEVSDFCDQIGRNWWKIKECWEWEKLKNFFQLGRIHFVIPERLVLWRNSRNQSPNGNFKDHFRNRNPVWDERKRQRYGFAKYFEDLGATHRSIDRAAPRTGHFVLVLLIPHWFVPQPSNLTFLGDSDVFNFFLYTHGHRVVNGWLQLFNCWKKWSEKNALVIDSLQTRYQSIN